MLFVRLPRRVKRFPSMTARMSCEKGSDAVLGPVESSIREKLATQLQPSELTITNNSWQHRHHAAMKDGGGGRETHFTINVVSEHFKGKTTIQRHRMIYTALSDELSHGLHALSLKTKTLEETQETQTVMK